MAAFWDLWNEERVDDFDRMNIYDINDALFYKLFRFDKVTFKRICALIDYDLRRPTYRNRALESEVQLAAALRYYATGEFQLDAGFGIRISQPSAFRSVSNVGKCLNNLFDDFVKWPSDADLIHVKKIFHLKAGFPNVMGIVDGTHIRIRSTEQQYINRKFYHSLNVQVICDGRGLFTNVYVNWPGSSHDAFILRQSSVWEHMERSPFHGYILGDSAYPLRKWLMTPLSNPISHSEREFNKSLKRTRVLIENTIGRWKKRFHLLHCENRRRIDNVVEDVRACAVLHNIAILSKQNDIEEDIPDDQPSPELLDNSHESGSHHRHSLINNVFTQ